MSDKMHPRKAWQQKQLEAMNTLLKAEYKNPPQTQREKRHPQFEIHDV